MAAAEQTDEELMVLVHGGHQQAVADVSNRYGRKMLGTGIHPAEDGVQGVQQEEFGRVRCVLPGSHQPHHHSSRAPGAPKFASEQRVEAPVAAALRGHV